MYPYKDRIFFYWNKLRYPSGYPKRGTKGTSLKVNLPMAESLFVPPLFFPTERIRSQNQWAMLDLKLAYQVLYRTLNALGYSVNESPTDKADIVLEWGASRLNQLKGKTVLMLEHGWIPRWSYQLSPLGSNARGHYSRDYAPSILAEAEKEFTRNYLKKMREIFEISLSAERLQKVSERFSTPFILFPFQLANDHNLRDSGGPFKSCYGKSARHQEQFNQACVDYLEAADLPLPVVFRQHPVDATQNWREKIKLRKPGNVLLDNREGISSMELLASGNCRLAVTVNSNTLHEAVVWNVPGICLGTLLWNPETHTPPFPSNLKDSVTLCGTRAQADPNVLAYMHHVIKHQWFLSDFHNPLIVRELIETQGLCEALSTRQKHAL